MHNHKWLCAETSIASAHTEHTPNFKGNSQAIQDVDFFIIIIIIRFVAFHHLLTNGCSAMNGCRQNESPNSW